MAFDDLVTRLTLDTEAEARAIVDRADAEVRAIEAESDRALAALSGERRAERRAARAAIRDRELAAARRDAQAEELRAWLALRGRVLARARALIPEIAASEEYRRILPAHADEALSYVAGVSVRLRIRPALTPWLDDVLARHPTAALVADDAISAGVIVEAVDGSVAIDNTVTARLSRIEPRLAVELPRELDHVGA